MNSFATHLAEQQARDAAAGHIVTDIDGKPIWAEPLDLLREMPVPAFGDDTAPPAVLRLARDFALAGGFDPAGVILAANVSAAAAIDDRYRLEVRPSANWYESARLWGVLIGPPSAGKTPTLRIASEPIKYLHIDAIAQWHREHPDLKAEGVPPRPALFTSDATIEKLSELLRDNPRGMLMLTEEFASWIGGIDGYREAASARGRGEWLQLYDGGPHQIDRVMRGSFLVKNWSCGVLAAATPAGLRQHLRKLSDDGLIHRFMPVVVRRLNADDGDADSTAAREDWDAAITKAYRETTREERAGAVRMSAGARKLFDAERDALRELVDAAADTAPALASHLGKHPGMIARLALTYHGLDGVGMKLDVAHMAMAIGYLRIIRSHAAALFGSILSASPAVDLARQLAASIVASRLTEGSRNAFSQHCRMWRGASEADQRQAVQVLTDARWLAADEGTKPYGGWARRWLVNPMAIERYAEHGRARLDARRRVASLFAGD
jgi:hypothetical protein